jgi:hypothetical protein
MVYPVKLILVERNNLRAELESQGVQHDLIPSAEVFPDTSTTTSRVRQDQFEHSKRTTKGRAVVFVVRTAEQFHQKRIGVLLDTWISRTQPYQVHVFSDTEDDKELLTALDKSSVGFQFVSECSHNISYQMRLCCKTGKEQKFFVSLITQDTNSDLGWFCHVDDDMYINLKVLYSMLDRYRPHQEKVYFGRKTNHRLKTTSSLLPADDPRRQDRYYLMYGGFYCMSRKLVQESAPYLSGSRVMQSTCRRAQENDDTSVGAVVNLVVDDVIVAHSRLIHHHVRTDPLGLIPAHILKEQIAISYGFGNRKVFTDSPNVVNISKPHFTIKEDPTRLIVM